LKFNSSELPRFPVVLSALSTFRDKLRKHDLDIIWNLAKASRLDVIFNGKKETQKLNQECKLRILQKYEPDISILTEITGIDFSSWFHV
jgi:hypothetical protein